MWEYDLFVSEYIEELKARKKKAESDEAAAKSNKNKSKYKPQRLPKFKKP